MLKTVLTVFTELPWHCYLWGFQSQKIISSTSVGTHTTFLGPNILNPANRVLHPYCFSKYFIFAFTEFYLKYLRLRFALTWGIFRLVMAICIELISNGQIYSLRCRNSVTEMNEKQLKLPFDPMKIKQRNKRLLFEMMYPFQKLTEWNYELQQNYFFWRFKLHWCQNFT